MWEAGKLADGRMMSNGADQRRSTMRGSGRIPVWWLFNECPDTRIPSHHGVADTSSTYELVATIVTTEVSSSW